MRMLGVDGDAAALGADEPAPGLAVNEDTSKERSPLLTFPKSDPGHKA